MELEQLNEKLENIKWLDKEIEELKLEIESLDSGLSFYFTTSKKF